MNGEPIPFLKLSANPNREDSAIASSLRETERFLANLEPDKQAAFIGELIGGTKLESIHGAEEGRKLAELRLDKLRSSIVQAGAKLFLPQRHPVKR